MGLFDWIRCEYPIPGDPGVDVSAKDEFQTKDLDCMLARFLITKHGTLVLEKTPGPLSYFDLPHFTGSINFYTLVDEAPGTDGRWVEYQAVFQDGIVTSITQKESSDAES